MADRVLDPTAVHVVLTTRWAGTAYRSSTIRRVESYQVETALDSDADSWAIELGNLTGDLNALLARDNEVRTQIYGAGDKRTFLVTGIMDDANYSEQGTIILNGRDLSAIPVDSDHYPDSFRGMNAPDIIRQEAESLGMTTKFRLSKAGGPKTQLTDGSEKYWEFWYRMIRKEKQWLWTEPDGTLVSSVLNYAASPKYKFASVSVAKADEIPVMSFQFRKTTQNRFGQVAIVWRSQTQLASGAPPNIHLQDDPTIKAWRKKPQKIIEDKHAKTKQEASKMADEEIYESKVGALEILVTVPDPGFLIDQNNMARLRLPEYGISGEWFVVGTIIRGDTSGFVQDIRLREKNFAISERVPDDPEWDKTTAAADNPTGEIGAGAWPTTGVAKYMGDHPEWWDCFFKAANEWRGSFAQDLFMATLLAICDHETGFANIRSNNQADGNGNEMPAPGQHGVEWYDIRSQSPTTAELEDWKMNFANEGGDGYLTWDCAVGPMQLYSAKAEADQHNGGKVDEFFGKRWSACDNIWEAAKLLHSKISYQSGKEDDLWAGVCAYGGWSPGCSYGQNIKERVHSGPPSGGWLAMVDEALASGSAQIDPATQQPSSPGSAASFAKTLQAYYAQGKFHDDNGSIMTQVNKVATGQQLSSQCGDKVWGDEHVYGALCYLIENGYNIGCFALTEDHSCYVSGTTRKSQHSLGKAVDISSIGIPGLGWYNLARVDSTGTRLAIQVMELLKVGGWLLPRQIICNGVGEIDKQVQVHQWNDGPTDYITDDHIDHIHVGY